MLLPRLWLFNLTFQKWKAKQITGYKMYKEYTWLLLKNPGAISAQPKWTRLDSPCTYFSQRFHHVEPRSYFNDMLGG